MVDLTGRLAGFGRAFVVILALSSLTASPAMARQDNFNSNARGNANGNGIANANCNSALILFCEGASGAPVLGPGALGVGWALGLLALGGTVAVRRRRAA